MLGVRSLVNKECGIPFRDMKGFRAPYLETNENVRKVLFDDDFIEYDSTYNPYKKTMAPFTMDSGLVKNSSLEFESWPGLWQIPVNEVEDETYESAYSMDPGRISQGVIEPYETEGEFIPAENMLDLLVNNFHKQYNGSRLPFSVNFHTPWLNAPGYSAALGEFLEYVRNFDDVYFITYSELVAWMRNPVPLDEMPPKNSQCIPITVPPIKFWSKYGTAVIVASIVIGPVLLMSVSVLIAQIIFLVFFKKTA